MKTSIHVLRLVAGIAGSAIIGTPAFALDNQKFVGDPGDEGAVQRVITIKPGAKWVNVNAAETVKIVDAATGKSFVWFFDTPEWTTFDLAGVAPSGILAGRRLTAYVGKYADENGD